jgi:DNA-binding transcriptional LysR family regulator
VRPAGGRGARDGGRCGLLAGEAAGQSGFERCGAEQPAGDALPPDSWNSLILQEAFNAIGCKMPHIGVESFSVALRYRLLATGRFVSALPGSMLNLNTKPYLLRILPIDLPSRPWPVVLVTLKNRTLAPAVELYVQCARATLSAMPSRLSSSNRSL